MYIINTTFHTSILQFFQKTLMELHVQWVYRPTYRRPNGSAVSWVRFNFVHLSCGRKGLATPPKLIHNQDKVVSVISYAPRKIEVTGDQ